MSDDSPTEVTSAQLNDWLQRDRKKQRMVADRLLVSERTIDGWRHGGSIPPRYQVVLRQMMEGEDSMVLSLPPDTMARIAEQAKRKGFKSKEAYIAEMLKGFMALMLLGVIGYQVSHPGDLQARRVGRRRDGVGCIELMGEA